MEHVGLEGDGPIGFPGSAYDFKTVQEWANSGKRIF